MGGGKQTEGRLAGGRRRRKGAKSAESGDDER